MKCLMLRSEFLSSWNGWILKRISTILKELEWWDIETNFHEHRGFMNCLMLISEFPFELEWLNIEANFHDTEGAGMVGC